MDQHDCLLLKNIRKYIQSELKNTYRHPQEFSVNKDMIAAENNILKSLKYSIERIPSSFIHLQRFCIILNTTVKEFKFAELLLELFLHDNNFCIDEYPSMNALVAICLACKLIDSGYKSPKNFKEFFFKDSEIDSCWLDSVPHDKLRSLFVNAISLIAKMLKNQIAYNCIYQKFKRGGFIGVLENSQYLYHSNKISH